MLGSGCACSRFPTMLVSGCSFSLLKECPAGGDQGSSEPWAPSSARDSRWVDEAAGVLLRQAALAVASARGQNAREAARVLIHTRSGAGAPAPSAVRTYFGVRGTRTLALSGERLDADTRRGSESAAWPGPGKGLGSRAREESMHVRIGAARRSGDVRLHDDRASRTRTPSRPTRA